MVALTPLAGRPRPASRPDHRLIAIGTMLADYARACSEGELTVGDAETAFLTAAADLYALAYGFPGALAIPAGTRVPQFVSETVEAVAS